jgi:hypothetical protein
MKGIQNRDNSLSFWGTSPRDLGFCWAVSTGYELDPQVERTRSPERDRPMEQMTNISHWLREFSQVNGQINDHDIARLCRTSR